jgi:hypothetical protein
MQASDALLGAAALNPGFAQLGAELFSLSAEYRSLADGFSTAALRVGTLQSKVATAIANLDQAISYRQRDLDQGLASVRIDFEMDPIANSACGFDLSLEPTSYSTLGVDAISEFKIGQLSAFSREDFDGTLNCEGTIGIRATRTISGVASLGVIQSSGFGSTPFDYEVLLGTGFDHLNLPELDQRGLIPVGSSIPFNLYGSLASPFTITRIAPAEGYPADSVVGIPEPDSLMLMIAGLAGIFFLSRRRSV